MMDFPAGAYDLHIHTSPDVVSRKCNDIELAQRLVAAKMAGCAIKCHYSDTASRAMLLRKQFPQLNVAGGIVLNRAVGGLNPTAVECSAKLGGKMLWFPTMDSLAYQTFRNPAGADSSVLLTVCNAEGRLLPSAQEILGIAAKYHLVTGTGHLSPQEGMALVQEGNKRGVQMVLTHADNPANQYSLEQMEAAVRLGAIVEFCFFTVYYQRTPVELIAGYIRRLGAAHIIITTDFGQLDSPYSDEGIMLFAKQLLSQGISPDEIYQMAQLNPGTLIK